MNIDITAAADANYCKTWNRLYKCVSAYEYDEVSKPIKFDKQITVFSRTTHMGYTS